MGRRLTGRYVLRNPDTQLVERFGPEDDVPEWAASLITDESAWTSEQEEEDQADRPEMTPPPKVGRGSSSEAWREYARLYGHPVADDETRDNVIALLEGHGVPTE
jgi:hypothetical protein